MSVWEAGYGEQPEDERENAWVEPDDEQADGWKGEPSKPWQTEGEEWREHPMGPEERAYREVLEAEEDDDHGPAPPQR